MNERFFVSSISLFLLGAAMMIMSASNLEITSGRIKTIEKIHINNGNEQLAMINVLFINNSFNVAGIRNNTEPNGKH